MTTTPEPGALRADLIAGLSLAGLLLPEAVAYSGLANLPPQAGVIALFCGLLCYALFGSSRFAIVSATSSSAAVLLSATSHLAGSDTALRLLLSAALILLCGVFFVAASLARLGGIANFIAKPVLRGFAFGLALTIVIKQLPHVLGVQPTASDLFHFSLQLLTDQAGWNLTSLMLGAGALALLILLKPLAQVPGALIVIALGIALSLAGVTQAHGVPEVGPFSLTLDLPSPPMLGWSEWLPLAGLAFALTLIVYAESYGSISTSALRHGDSTAPNRDLLALGVSNLVSGLMHGMPVGAGYSATSANEAAGAHSKRAGLAAAGIVLLMVLALLPLIAHTPEPVLAAIVIHAVGHTLKPGTLRPYFRWHRDRLLVLAAIAAVLVLGVVNGLLVSIALSVVMLLHSLSEPNLAWLGQLDDGHDFVDIRRHPEATVPTGMLIARPGSPLFFANADSIFSALRARLDAQPATQTLILSLEESDDLDSSSLEALGDFADWMQRNHRRLVLARIKDDVRDLLQRTGLPTLQTVVLAWSVDDAVKAAT